MEAGSAAVRFNSPMSRARAVEISAFVSEHAESVVDLGCGYGALAVEMAAQHAHLRVVGIDSDARAVERGRAIAASLGLAERVRFHVGDVADMAEPADIAVCVGSSHAFGGTAEMLGAMRRLGTSGAVIGDMVWSTTPNQEHVELFGDLPKGEEGLADLASAAGWTVTERSRSSLSEWDEFEHGWIDGARRVGTSEADAFADERLEGFKTYRGVAGFGWLFLTQ